MREKIDSKEESIPTRFKFIYVYHEGAASAEKVWGDVLDCDVILLENTGFNQEEKEVWENAIHYATFDSGTTGENLRQEFLPRREENWGLAMIARAIESKKEFHFIDVLKDSPAAELCDEAHFLRIESVKQMRHGHFGKSLESMEAAIVKFGRSNRMRTETVIQQIHDLTEKAGEKWEGKKIAVIGGSGHEAIFDAFKRTYLGDPDNLSKVKSVKKMFPLLLSAIKKQEVNPDNNIEKDELIKILLSLGVVLPYLQTTRPERDEDELQTLADEIVCGLTNGEVMRHWKTLTEPEDETGLIERIGNAAQLMTKNFFQKSPDWTDEVSSLG